MMAIDLGGGRSEQPMFSVIMPAFNRAHLIARAIESATAQRFGDFELLIIDDGSRDNTFEVVRPFILADPRIRYHFATNRGLPMARNLGLINSTGKYITFLDSDDEYLVEHLEARAEVLQKNPEIDLLHGGIEIIGDPFVADKHNPAKQIHLRDCVVGGTFCIKRSLAEALGGFRDVDYGDDSDFFQRALDSGAMIEKIDAPTYRYYRTESDSLCAIVEREGIEGIMKFRTNT